MLICPSTPFSFALNQSPFFILKVSLNKHIDSLAAMKLTFLESVTKTFRLALIGF